MLKNYLKTTLRYFIRNQQHVLINLAGLSIGIALCIIAYINYDFAQNFDATHTKAREIYRLNLIYHNKGDAMKVGIAPLPLYDLTKSNIGDVENIIRYGEENISLRSEEETFGVKVGFTDPEFFEMFDFGFIHGDPSVLSDYSTMIITEDIAMKYFGKTDVIGETFTAIANDEILDFKVGGIMENPPWNGSFRFGVIAHINGFFEYQGIDASSTWGYPYLMFLHIPDENKVDPVFKEIEKYLYAGLKDMDLKLELFAYPEPFYGMSSRPRFRSYWLNRGVPKYGVSIPLFLSLMVLIIACINFTNTTIAIAGQRLKEIGVRKVMGGVKKQLIVQFLTESLLVCIFAMILGLILAEILVPVYSDLWSFLKLELTYSENLDFLAFIFLLLILTAFLAGGYPAVYISKFKPTSILKGQTVLMKANWYTKGLLFVQFMVSVVMVVVTLGYWENYKYHKDFELGFRSEGIIYHYLNNGDEVSLLARELEKYPQVKSVQGSVNNIYNLNEYWKFEINDYEIRADILKSDPGYLDFMGVEIIGGRNFKENSIDDREESILINEAFAEKLEVQDPIGKELIFDDSIKVYVIGVFRNIYSRGFFEAIRPMVIMYEDEADFRQIMVKANTTDLIEVEKKLGELYRKQFPNRIYNPSYMDETVARALEMNKKAMFIFLILGLITLLLTGTGLYSLISMNIARRTKEMGIRKVLGAKLSSIVWHLNYQFAGLLVLSLIIGLPLGKYFADFLMDIWFYYYHPIGAISLILSIIIVLSVSIISIAGKVRKAATDNPVNSLRSE